MLIGGNDISYDVVTLGTCFSMFVYIRATGGNQTVQLTGSHRGIGGGIQIPETWLHNLFSFLFPSKPAPF